MPRTIASVQRTCPWQNDWNFAWSNRDMCQQVTLSNGLQEWRVTCRVCKNLPLKQHCCSSNLTGQKERGRTGKEGERKKPFLTVSDCKIFERKIGTLAASRFCISRILGGQAKTKTKHWTTGMRSIILSPDGLLQQNREANVP